MTAAGYLGTPLAKKLGVKAGSGWAVLNEPSGFRSLLVLDAGVLGFSSQLVEDQQAVPPRQPASNLVATARTGDVIGSIVVLGAGVGGLAAAIGLAKAGHDVTVVERDPPPPDCDGDDAFSAWERRHVPQFRQAHGFSARSRNLLLEHAPEVVERLRADGIEEMNFFKLLAPPEIHTPEDERFTVLRARRAAFELALRRTVEDHPSVVFRCPATVVGLTTADGLPAPTATGVTLDDGEQLGADVVIDALGRRTPVPGWLRESGIDVPEAVQACEMTYHTRYYRQSSDSAMSQEMLPAVRTDLDGLLLLGFGGDHDTFAITAGAPPWDEELKVLRHNWGYEALVNAIPASAVWVAPDNATPLNDVETMAGHSNVRRRYVVDGEPLVAGLFPVGDSMCTTNPAFGWGASMALTYAFAAVAAVAEHDDLVDAARAYDAAVAGEADEVYAESAAMDRLRTYRWKGEPVPVEDQPEAERQSLITDGVIRGALGDPDLGRAFLRRIHLLESPRAILDDPVVRERAEKVRAHFASKPPAPSGPDREQLLAAIAAAAPT